MRNVNQNKLGATYGELVRNYDLYRPFGDHEVELPVAGKPAFVYLGNAAINGMSDEFDLLKFTPTWFGDKRSGRGAWTIENLRPGSNGTALGLELTREARTIPIGRSDSPELASSLLDLSTLASRKHSTIYAMPHAIYLSDGSPDGRPSSNGTTVFVNPKDHNI